MRFVYSFVAVLSLISLAFASSAPETPSPCKPGVGCCKAVGKCPCAKDEKKAGNCCCKTAKDQKEKSCCGADCCCKDASKCKCGVSPVAPKAQSDAQSETDELAIRRCSRSREECCKANGPCCRTGVTTVSLTDDDTQMAASAVRRCCKVREECCKANRACCR